MLIGKSFGVAIGVTALLCSACVRNASDNGETEINTQVNVKITRVSVRDLTLSDEVMATSFYPDKNDLLSPATGYVLQSMATIGKLVERGIPLFTIETEEHRALKGSQALIDSSFSKAGVFVVKSETTGFVTEIFHQPGDFVQQGTALCSFTHATGMAFKGYVPFAFHQFITPGKLCMLILPDGTTEEATFTGKLNTVETASQTEVYLITPKHSLNLPEGLNVRVEFKTKEVKEAQLLPKSAVLSNETLDKFWVMKLSDDSTAVKIPVEIQSNLTDSVVVQSPRFLPTDRILTEGNYGLPDTARVKLVD